MGVANTVMRNVSRDYGNAKIMGLSVYCANDASFKDEETGWEISGSLTGTDEEAATLLDTIRSMGWTHVTLSIHPMGFGIHTRGYAIEDLLANVAPAIDLEAMLAPRQSHERGLDM